ncbi:MAG: GyrI-like domain-containing protein [Putridiphycobacter sp.]
MFLRIENIKDLKVVGVKSKMSFSANTTKLLWQRFMPNLSKIKHRKGTELISIDNYPKSFFTHFNPENQFEKWAAVAIQEFERDLLPGFSALTIKGDYAVFLYKGKPSESQPFFQKIFYEWLPQSKYKLDNRPHFSVMGDKYKGEDSASEEEIWIPIQEN